MTDCSLEPTLFPSVKSKKVEVKYDGKEVTSDAGVLLLKEADKKLNLLSSLAEQLVDRRRIKGCSHSLSTLIKQRVYGIAMGYEDLNDHDQLRKDAAFQTATSEDKNLASSSTLCRLENTATRETAIAITKVMVKTFIESYKTPPEQIILDFDATDDRVHGNQQGSHYNGYYKDYCFLPLYVFCGDQLLVSYLRPSNIDGAKHTWAILALLVKELRKHWPDVIIIFRADSGFCRDQIFTWCHKNQVFYIVAMGKNAVLRKKARKNEKKAAKKYYLKQETATVFGHFTYKAKSWKMKRKVIVKTERNEDSSSSRFLITNLPWDAEVLYSEVYCPRGNMENGIKQVQLDLFSDRTSCNDWWANQFRVLLSSLAYILLEYIRRVALTGTKLAKSTVGNIRLKLLKVGAVIISNTRRVSFSLSSYFPNKEIFQRVAQILLE